MATFDPAKGAKKTSDEVDDLSNEFADELAELPMKTQRNVLRNALSRMDNLQKDPSEQTDDVSTANSSTGGLQLTTGSSNGTQVTSERGLAAILADPTVDSAIKAALTRILSPDDDHYMPVDRAGTPIAVINANQERDRQKARAEAAEQAKATAEQKLADANDEGKSDSLAGKLKAATAANATPTDKVEKAKVKALSDQLEAALAKSRPANMGSGTILPKEEAVKVKQVNDELKTLGS